MRAEGVFALVSRFHILGYLERIMGVEPTTSAWEANVLPINYIRTDNRGFFNLRSKLKKRQETACRFQR